MFSSELYYLIIYVFISHQYTGKLEKGTTDSNKQIIKITKLSHFQGNSQQPSDKHSLNFP